MTNDANMRERLNDIWDAWTLTPNDDAIIEKQHEVLPAVSAWLEAGKNDPEIVIRAVQLLLADPERPDLKQRACWKTVRKALTDVWKAAGTGDKPFFYVQALLLAAWPKGSAGHFRVKPLMDSGWDLQQRRTLKEIADWRRSENAKPLATKKPTAQNGGLKVVAPAITQFAGAKTDLDTQIKQIEQYAAHGGYSNMGSPIAHVFKAHDKAIATLSSALSKATAEAAQGTSKLATALESALQQHQKVAEQSLHNAKILMQAEREKTEFLWWGQSRYCHTLRKPYRRLKADKPALLWWATREAAEIAQSVDVESAAAYLVQTLEDLGQNVDEMKPVLEWMRDLHATLLQGGTDVPALSKRLDQIAGADALGLPVTWVRRKAVQKEPFNDEDARNDIALPLDGTIDLGDWASWIFRETLLDLHLAENK